jgi:hypothetical protein
MSPASGAFVGTVGRIAGAHVGAISLMFAQLTSGGKPPE